MLHTQSIILYCVVIEIKTVITDNGALPVPVQKTCTCLESSYAFFSPVFTVSVQKLALVVSSPSLYNE